MQPYVWKHEVYPHWKASEKKVERRLFRKVCVKYRRTQHEKTVFIRLNLSFSQNLHENAVSDSFTLLVALFLIFLFSSSFFDIYTLLLCSVCLAMRKVVAKSLLVHDAWEVLGAVERCDVRENMAFPEICANTKIGNRSSRDKLLPKWLYHVCLQK
jgi:hypothetical protein